MCKAFHFLAEGCSWSSTTRESSCAQHCATSKRSCWKPRTWGSRRAGQQVSKQQAGTARVVRGLGGRAARRAMVEAERGAVLLEHLLQLALRDAQLALARLEGLRAREQLGLRLQLT